MKLGVYYEGRLTGEIAQNEAGVASHPSDGTVVSLDRRHLVVSCTV